MRLNPRLLTSFLLLLTTVSFSQQRPLDVSTITGVQLVPSTVLQVWEDESKKLDFPEISDKPYAALNANVPNFGFKNSSYWFKIPISNESSHILPFLIEAKNPNLDLFKVILVSPLDTVTYECGDQFPFHQRAIFNKYLQVKQNLMARTAYTLYVNVQNSGEQFQVPLFWGPPEAFKNDELTEQIIFGIYFGIIAFAFLINLFFFLVLKDKPTLLYLGYLFGLAFLQLSLTGFGFQYVWPDSTFLAKHANPIFANSSILFLLLFSIRFLKIEEHLPKLARVYRYMSYVVVLSTICSLIPAQGTYITSVLTINVIALLLNFMIIPTSVIIYRRGYKPARFFAVAFVVLIIGVFLFIMKNFGVVDPNPWTEFGIQIGSACEVLLLTLAVIDRFREFKEESLHNLEEVNRLKTQANKELEVKVKERTAEINRQKEEIEHKNDEIVSSIRYAKRIQEAILPPDSMVRQYLPDGFIFYQPKDIVAGDFYFLEHVGDLVIFAAADCTGHGVPGAMVSVVCSNALTRTVKEFGILDPGKILDKVRDLVVETFEKSESEVKDGMDISLCVLNRSTGELKWAGANNPLWCIRKNSDTIEEWKPDKQPIGKFAQQSPFTTHDIILKPGDCIYLFTDGYADQFGGEQGKKYKAGSMKKFFLSIAEKPMPDQSELSKENINQWMQGYEQIDDICLMGMRF